MSRLRRFEQIEPGGAGPAASGESTAGQGVEGRFGAAVAKPQVLDLSEGQAFVRCAVCRGDSHATARTCCRCEARLDTPEQRAFNEAFWKQRQAEDAELRAETDRLRAAREKADREVSEARRYVEWMDQEIALRRARRLTRRDGELVITFSPDVRPLGLAIGRFLRRVVRGARRLLLRDPGEVGVSQSVDVVIVVKGLSELVAAIVEGGFEHEKAKQFEGEDGRVHPVDLVVRDQAGTAVGVKVDPKTGTATFVGHDASGKARALANRVAQRYAYSKITQELQRKGYQIAKEEKQKDGTIRLVAQRWR